MLIEVNPDGEIELLTLIYATPGAVPRGPIDPDGLFELFNLIEIVVLDPCV
jgi:hypothetical protein